MSHKFNTTLFWHDSTGGECEAEVTVHYDRHKGFAGDRTDPPEDASVEITAITGADPDVPARFYQDENLIAECLEHWAEADASAAEYRAEQRADDLMRERWS